MIQLWEGIFFCFMLLNQWLTHKNADMNMPYTQMHMRMYARAHFVMKSRLLKKFF